MEGASENRKDDLEEKNVISQQQGGDKVRTAMRMATNELTAVLPSNKVQRRWFPFLRIG
jgi:hypothetical protein